MRLVIRMSQVDSEDKESAAPIFQLASPSSPASLSSAVGDFEMLERTAKSEPAASVPGDVPPSDDLAAELASRQWEGGTTDTAAAPVPSAPVAEAATDTAAATDAEVEGESRTLVDTAGVRAAMATGVVSNVKHLEGKGFGFIKPDNGEAASRRARACSRPHSAQRRSACAVSI